VVLIRWMDSSGRAIRPASLLRVEIISLARDYVRHSDSLHKNGHDLEW
jgi:hypothetical protein